MTTVDANLIRTVAADMLEVFLSTESCDRERAQQAVSRMYEYHDVPPPRDFLWYPSISKAARAAMLCAWMQACKITLKDQSPSDMILYALDAAGKNCLVNLDLHEKSLCYTSRFLDLTQFWQDETLEVLEEHAAVLRRACRSVRNLLSLLPRLAIEEQLKQNSTITFWDDLFGEVLSGVTDKDVDYQFNRSFEMLNRFDDRQHRFTLNCLNQFLFSASSEDALNFTQARFRFGNHEADLVARYAIKEQLGIAVPASVPIHEEIVKSCGSYCAFADVCIMVERPSEIHIDVNGLLHQVDDVAYRTEDSWSFYALHGIHVPAYIARGDFTTQQIDSMRNVELRRAMIDRYGVAKYFTETGAKLIAEDRYGKLYRKTQRNDEDIVLLEVLNSTAEPDGTFKTYHLRVPPHVQTPQQAVAWTFDTPPTEYNPVVES